MAENVAHRSDELDLDSITPDLLRALNLGDVHPATRTAALRSLATAGVWPIRYRALSCPTRRGEALGRGD
jgi:hypothetical protein